MKNRIKIRGVTGIPFLFTRWRGFLDGKLGAAVLDSHGKCLSHFLTKLIASYRAFVESTYKCLEQEVAGLIRESAELVVEHDFVTEKLNQPEEAATGRTTSMLMRNAQQLKASRTRLQARNQEILLRLAALEENLQTMVDEASATQGQAVSLTEQRASAYLHGVSIAWKSVNSTSLEVEYKPIGERFLTSHHSNCDERLRVLHERRNYDET